MIRTYALYAVKDGGELELLDRSTICTEIGLQIIGARFSESITEDFLYREAREGEDEN